MASRNACPTNKEWQAGMLAPRGIMTEVTLTHFLILSAFLFSCGVLCVASKRNAIGILMGVELILNAANVNFVAFARFSTAFQLEGQIFALMVIVLDGR